MRFQYRLLALPLLLLLPACTHVSGIVEQSPGRPLTTAILSVGRPDGIAVYATYHVDAKGHYDIQLAPTDETDLYIYDGAGDPQLTLRRLEKNEIRENAVIHLRPANANTDLGPGSP